MIVPADRVSEIVCDFTAAARKALRFHPEFHLETRPLEEVAKLIGSLISAGDPGAVVKMWGRSLAADILAVVDGMDGDERVEKLREAVDKCISFRDCEGSREASAFQTSSRKEAGALFAKSLAEASEEEIYLRAILHGVYMKHGDTLPEGLFGPAYEGWASRYSQPVEFSDLANLLYYGGAYDTVDIVGLEYSRHLLAALEQAELFELCAAMRAVM